MKGILWRFRHIAQIKKGRSTKNYETKALEGTLPLITMGYLRGKEEPIFVKPQEEDILCKETDIVILWDGANAGEFFFCKAGCPVFNSSKNFSPDSDGQSGVLFLFVESGRT